MSPATAARTAPAATADEVAPHARSRALRVADDAARRARLVVVPRRRYQAPAVPFVFLLTVVLLGGVVGLLMFNTSMQQASFTNQRLQDQATVLSARQEALSSQLEALNAPDAVAARAQALGLVVPNAPRTLDLRTGKITGAAPDQIVSAPLVLHPQPVKLPKELAQPAVPPTSAGMAPEGTLPAGDAQGGTQGSTQDGAQAGTTSTTGTGSTTTGATGGSAATSTDGGARRGTQDRQARAGR